MEFEQIFQFLYSLVTLEFFFRKNIQCCKCDCEPQFVEMTVNEIINGSEDFPGVGRIIRAYINNMVRHISNYDIIRN